MGSEEKRSDHFIKVRALRKSMGFRQDWVTSAIRNDHGAAGKVRRRKSIPFAWG
jgi:hypothetical protein